MKTELNSRQFYRTVAVLVLPIALQNLINVGVTSADVIMLGRVGENALSGVSLANQVYFILSLIYFGLTSGAAVLTAQYWGKQDVRTIERILGISLRVGIYAGLLFTVVAWLFPVPVMKIFTNEPTVIAEGVKYIKIVSCSYVLSGITCVYLSIMRSVERVIVATVVYLISLTVNVVINAILIFGLLGAPQLGSQGAAVGTLVARCTEILLVIIYARKFNDTVKVRFRDLLERSPQLMSDFRVYAVPVLLNELAWGLGMAMISAIVGHLGSAAVAAHSVTQVSRQLAMVVGFGVASATAILCGKAIGERKEELAKEYARRLTRLSIVVGVCGSCVILAVLPLLHRVMNLTPQARSYLTVMFFIMAYFVIFQTLNSTWIVGVFRSGGDTRFGLILDSAALWGVSICVGAFSAFVLKIPMPWVYMILCADEVIKMPFSWKRYRSYRWLKNITR